MIPDGCPVFPDGCPVIPDGCSVFPAGSLGLPEAWKAGRPEEPRSSANHRLKDVGRRQDVGRWQAVGRWQDVGQCRVFVPRLVVDRLFQEVDSLRRSDVGRCRDAREYSVETQCWDEKAWGAPSAETAYLVELRDGKHLRESPTDGSSTAIDARRRDRHLHDRRLRVRHLHDRLAPTRLRPS